MKQNKKQYYTINSGKTYFIINYIKLGYSKSFIRIIDKKPKGYLYNVITVNLLSSFFCMFKLTLIAMHLATA